MQQDAPEGPLRHSQSVTSGRRHDSEPVFSDYAYYYDTITFRGLLVRSLPLTLS